MSAAVLMPVFNEGPTVGGVIDEVVAHFDGPVIVVDDGSTDATPEVLAHRPDVSVLTITGNCGRKARSLGIAVDTGALRVRKVTIQPFPALCQRLLMGKYLPDLP